MANTNIINAVFGSGICAVTTSAFRANYGMVLRFSGIELPTAFEVDFSNYDVMGRDSITMIGQDGEVQIPDDLWDSGLNIYAYIYLHPTDQSGVTVYTVTIPVLGRPNRTEEEPTPHEQSVIEQAIAALNDAVEATAADVETTTANAQAAAQSEANAATSERSATASAGAALASQNAAESAAQSATESASGAAESARNAANSASAAAESATNAQESAEQAEQSAQSISGDVERAERAAATATDKATEASGSAATASAKATEAASSATAAAQSASSAASAAQNAASAAQAAESHAADAEQAKTDAQDAQAAAEQAAQSVSGLSVQITQNTADIAELVQSKAGVLVDTASGSIASFYPDATVPTVKGLTVDVEPQQDLHGYDAPWPAGGGKNLLNPSAYVFQTTTQNGLTYTVQSDGTIHVAGTATATGGPSLTGGLNFPNGTYTYLNETSQGVHCAYRGRPVSGGSTFSLPNTFTVDGTFMVYINMYCKATGTYNLTVHPQIELGSTATSFTPYSNICPISGWDSVEVQRTGKNLFGYSLPIHKGYWSSTSYVGDDSVVTLENATGWTNIRVPVKEGATITISGMQAQAGVYAAWLGSDNPTDVVSRFTNYSMNGTKTVPSGTKYLGLCFSNLSTAYADYPNAQINIGSTATAYEPYQGDTYQIQLGQTVYGCKLNVTQGKMVVTHGLFVPTTNAQIVRQPGRTHYYFNVVIRGMANTYVESGVISNIIKSGPFAGGNSVWGGSADLCCLREGGFSFYTDATKEMTAQESLQWLIDNGAQVYYPLATPITIDLTPLEISVLTGQTNNIWADSGDVSVEYAADLKTYIDNKIAAAVAALS